MRWARAVLAAGLMGGIGLPAAPAERVLLKSGFSIQAEKVELGERSVLLTCGGGVIEIPRDMVVRSEPIEEAVRTEQPEQVETLRPQETFDQILADAARRHGLPEAFVLGVAKAESGLKQDAVSPKGARGLMQLMPETARALGVDPDDPWQNAEGGVRYLRELLLRYADDPYQVRKALAAYNAGEGALKRYGGIPPYRETLEFIDRVLSQWRRSAQGGTR